MPEKSGACPPRAVRQSQKRLFNFTARLRQEAQAERRRLNRRRKKRILCAAAAAVAALLALSLALDRMVGFMRVTGDSMWPSLHPGDWVVYRRGQGEVKAGQLVLFQSGVEKEPLVKRVTALPGQTVEVLESGAVLVDGRPLEEPYALLRPGHKDTTAYPFTVPAGALFVLGDNRATSMDSRNAELGAVAQQAVLGRVIAVWRTSP